MKNSTKVILAVALVAILGLVYVLLRGDGIKIGSTGGVEGVPMRDANGEFIDGLVSPSATRHGVLDDFGAGTAVTDTFVRDLDGDGHEDRITRRRIENGTDHFYYEYKIEINNGNGFTDITPGTLRTTEGAECALTKLRFEFAPRFQIIKISRPWRDSWVTPSMAQKIVYTLHDGRFQSSAPETLRAVCDVGELF